MRVRRVESILNYLESFPCHVHHSIRSFWAIHPGPWLKESWTKNVDNFSPLLPKSRCILNAKHLPKNLHKPFTSSSLKRPTLPNLGAYRLGFCIQVTKFTRVFIVLYRPITISLYAHTISIEGTYYELFAPSMILCWQCIINLSKTNKVCINIYIYLNKRRGDRA